MEGNPITPNHRGAPERHATADGADVVSVLPDGAIKAPAQSALNARARQRRRRNQRREGTGERAARRRENAWKQAPLKCWDEHCWLRARLRRQGVGGGRSSAPRAAVRKLKEKYWSVLGNVQIGPSRPFGYDQVAGFDAFLLIAMLHSCVWLFGHDQVAGFDVEIVEMFDFIGLARYP